MNDYIHTAFDEMDITRVSSERLSLEVFAPQMRYHMWAILNSQDALKSLKDAFDMGWRVWPATCHHAIQSLIIVGGASQKFHAAIEDSKNLPLLIVPMRLSLLLTLKKIELQIMKLSQVLAALREKGKTSLSQPAEDRYTIVQELDVLIRYNEQAVQQAEELLRTAQEQERDYRVG